MSWNIAQAKQHFSKVIQDSAREPQPIYNRKQLVAVVVGAEDMAAFQAWRRLSAKRSLGDEFAELRQLLADGDYALPLPSRQDRPNAFSQMLLEEAHDDAA